MKEDKENTKPRERRMEPRGEDTDRQDKMKEKKEVFSKVVIRRLPPSLTQEQLEEHLQPLPDHDYFEFFANDSSLFPHMFSRAYINFKNQDDIVLFRDRFDGYVFIDHKGQEYPAVVEFAPFQKVAKKKSKKKDAKTGTIEEDPEYRKFLETYSVDDEKFTSTPETLLEEIEARNKELIAQKTTPLLSFLKNRQRIREEKREERRRRELERKRLREEERRKWKEDERRKRKESEKLKKTDRIPEREKDRSKDEPKIKKPEKDDERFDSERKFKSKRLERENFKDEKCASGQSSISAKKSDGENKDERMKKSEDECSKDYRDKDFEREREWERERRLREKDKLRRQDDCRKQRERYEKERCFRRREDDVRRRDDDVRRDKDLQREKMKKPEHTDFTNSSDKTDKATKEEKKEEAAKRDRIRNKDRPAMQLYQPGVRSRSRQLPCDEGATRSAERGDQHLESEINDAREE
ncbi:regulator of nonsense transcripts 3B isoform X2 [Ambystoma mexicanum]|uniref:regulator of nonsense transcripts 3B isoform X2 n=1 Tax=Ambystoma mexicanum TaxID=8296 RepID=UPI0037E8DCE6